MIEVVVDSFEQSCALNGELEETFELIPLRTKPRAAYFLEAGCHHRAPKISKWTMLGKR
jgi:hypothetical protein